MRNIFKFEVEWTRGRKNERGRISETVRDKAKLRFLEMANKKPYKHFQMKWKLSTLDDVENQYTLLCLYGTSYSLGYLETLDRPRAIGPTSENLRSDGISGKRKR